MEIREVICRRVIQELSEGQVVNLGIGIPTLVADYLPDDIQVIFQSENGMLGVGPALAEEMADNDIFNAGGAPVAMLEGGCFFDSAVSFGLIRGGHVDVTVLGALQVDAQGNLASWNIPGKWAPGMGGAMDLVVGAKRVIIAMEHTTKDGQPRILDRCTMPLTAAGEAERIITQLAVFDVTPEGLVLMETAPGVDVEHIRQVTDATFTVAKDCHEMVF